MAKITDPDLLIVGTNLTVDTSTKVLTLNAAGSLAAKDGVTLQALYSKLIELWTTSTYNKFPFPMYTIDARSGQFLVGTDGTTYNGWRFSNADSEATRNMIRDAGWSEYSAAGVLNRQHVGMVALASGFPAGAQFYYQRASGGAAINFAYNDAPNQGVQVYGDASNGNFDTRTFFKMFCRAGGYTFDDAVLGDVGETGTGAYKVQLPIAVNSDLKISVADGSIGGAPYSGITTAFYTADQNRTINGVSRQFRKIIAGNGATLEQIYTKVQYLLRQDSDINTGGTAGVVNGKTADQLCYFVGDTLYTTQGVYIDNIDANDANRVVFKDQGGVDRTNAYVAAGSITFNSFLQGADSYYVMYFTTLTGAGNDFGESGAVIVDNDSGVDIAGSISGASVSFTFDYDNNVQGGRTAGTDAAVTVAFGRKGSAKPNLVTGTITRSKGLVFACVAEQDRGYVNP